MAHLGTRTFAQVKTMNQGIQNGTLYHAIGTTLEISDGPQAGVRAALVDTGDVKAFIPQSGIIVSSAAPSNGDGRDDGTIYIQTA